MIGRVEEMCPLTSSVLLCRVVSQTSGRLIVPFVFNLPDREISSRNKLLRRRDAAHFILRINYHYTDRETDTSDAASSDARYVLCCSAS